MKWENINRKEMGLKASQPTVLIVFPFSLQMSFFHQKSSKVKSSVSWIGVFKDKAFVQPGSWDFVLDPVEKMAREETVMVSCDVCTIFIFLLLLYPCCKYSLVCLVEEKVK